MSSIQRDRYNMIFDDAVVNKWLKCLLCDRTSIPETLFYRRYFIKLPIFLWNKYQMTYLLPIHTDLFPYLRHIIIFMKHL